MHGIQIVFLHFSSPPILIKIVMTTPFFCVCVHPFHRFLAVLEVVKFMSMTRRNCRPFVLSLFSVHADGIIPRARYSPENKYCSGCNLFRMGCDIITVFEKYSPSETSFVSPSILNRASNRTLFSLVRTKSFCETTDSFPQDGCKAYLLTYLFTYLLIYLHT